MTINYPPTTSSNVIDWLRKLSISVVDTIRGKLDNTGTFTLTANSAITTVTESAGRIGENTIVIWMPITANAATAMANVYLSSQSVTNKTFTLTHTNNAQTDRTFSYMLIG